MWFVWPRGHYGRKQASRHEERRARKEKAPRNPNFYLLRTAASNNQVKISDLMSGTNSTLPEAGGWLWDKDAGEE
ncbi:hypothetical protein PoB_001189400 [Plakobranchus ocellatus]|uniref:Uncharacterized protein n=1 Tax=Plakobranchus ocellatus TaxID=259542 RepID=A0AAV3YTY6_9GAST|nr:hypothetical protein PoB_001189400 [Plakobranchus ocellatus]